nr:RNA-directed DNA polymerase, eukaryota, reverse transcriptase zinc-binding domain protein [Tanacetum cinerariifolium]
MNDSSPKFPPSFTTQHSCHYEYEKVKALRESTTPQDSKKVRNDKTFHQVLEESVNKSSGVSKTTHADSMAGPLKQRNGFFILEFFQEFIDIGQAMGYKINGAWASEEKAVGKETLSFESGTWMANNVDLLFISVYSPQDLSLKRVLWNYILETLNRWHDDFHSVIEDSWNNDGISASNSMILLKNKLNFLKQRLKEWSSIKRRNKDHDRKVIQYSLIEIDLRLDKGNGLPDDLTKRANLFRDLKDIDHKDSIDLAQKAKIKWVVEGDENSKFFNGIVNKKRRHLAIKGILVDSEWIENPNRIKSEFYSYYSNLFSAPAWDRSLFDVNFPRRLNSDQVFDLEDMVSNEEIKRAVWDWGSDKSPGQMDLPSIQEQSAFIKGRQIMDNPLILNEVISWCKARKEQLLMFKVDFQKAFNSVRWDHLDDILGKIGFGIKWRSIYGVDVRQADVQHMAENFGCIRSNLPFTYLGVKEKFKRLFNLELQKDANVASKLQASNVASSFRRPPHSGIENSQFIELGQILSSISLSSVSDRWSWTLHGLGDFSVKSAREKIDKHVLVVSPAQNRWSKVLSIKINVFSWRMMLDKLPSRSNLHNRGINITCILCLNCGAAIENRNHLFFDCLMSVDLARLIGRW